MSHHKCCEALRFDLMPFSISLTMGRPLTFLLRSTDKEIFIIYHSQYPPKYEYNYFVANRHTQAAQGHKEIRNGDNTRGNYFVNLPKGEGKTTVNYIADEWGFFPVTR